VASHISRNTSEMWATHQVAARVGSYLARVAVAPLLLSRGEAHRRSLGFAPTSLHLMTKREWQRVE
jgi:hypothetical protein